MSDSYTSDGVRCMLMRGGTSKGAYFLADDLPTDPEERNDLLLRIMGSPDARQVDGIGGAHPLTSKVAVVSGSEHPGVDVDYLFLQVSVDEALVSDRQNCGNLLAGVGPFALERGLVAAGAGESVVNIRMVNSDGYATAHISTPNGRVSYTGDTAIAGVPGTSAAVVIDFVSPAGAEAPRLLPTGNRVDVIDGVEVSCVDNGMPVVVLRASDLGVAGTETCAELEADDTLRGRLESLRLKAGQLMGLGDVTNLTVPKMTMVSAPLQGGSISTRTFIPHRCHTSIGVLGAASVALACSLPGTPGHALRNSQHTGARYRVEHPTGNLEVEVELEPDSSPEAPRVRRTGVVRTARKLFDGIVFPRP